MKTIWVICGIIIAALIWIGTYMTLSYVLQGTVEHIIQQNGAP